VCTIVTTCKRGLAPVIGLLAITTFAQIPDHPSGTICVTPRVWCVAEPRGQRGQPCFCATPYGRVQGQIR
jgi:hypothetical protein